MNWKGKVRLVSKIVLVLFALYGIGVFLFGYLEIDTPDFENPFQSHITHRYETINGEKQATTPVQNEGIHFGTHNKPSFEEISPDGYRTISVYRQDFDPLFFDEDTPDTVLMLVRFNDDAASRRIVFSGEERTGDPHWLGNNHIFFTSHCGSSCQGLYLVDVRSKKTLTGVLSSMFDDRMNWYMHFKDWFGNTFKFPGFVKKMYAQTQDDISYLIFDTEDEQGHDLGTKRFLFTGNSLRETP